MKKLTIGLAVLLSGVAVNSFAGISAGVSPLCVTVPSLCGGFNVGVTGLWWRAAKDHHDYALTFPAFTPDIVDPIDFFGPFDVVFADGHHHGRDHDHHWGYKINVGYVFPCSGNDVTLAYAHWDRDENDHVNRGAGVIIPTLTSGTLGGVILFPGTEITFLSPPLPAGPLTLADIFGFYEGVLPADALGGVPVDFARAITDIKYHAWDLEFGQYVSVGCNTRMRWFAGLRWAQIDHRLDALYSGALIGLDVTDAVIDITDVAVDSATLSMDAAINVYTKSDFNGVGPRFGTNVNYGFGNSGFGVIAEGSVSLLVGELDSHFRETEHLSATLSEVPDGGGALVSSTVVIDTTESFNHPDETRVVPNLEGKLAVDYAFVFCNRSKLSVEVGYMVTHYFSSNDFLSAVGLDAPEFRTRHTIDTSFDGPYVTLQYQM